MRAVDTFSHLTMLKTEHNGNMQQTLLTSEQYRNLTKKIILSIEKRHRIVPINSLKSMKYFLKSPIYITLEYEKGKVIAGFDDIEAFSYADTESEAVSQLCEEIIQIYEDLTEDRENLGSLPAKWLLYLEEIIGCR